MSQHLDLSFPTIQSNMLLASRQSPRLTLRRVASFNASDKGPLSSTSGAFSFNHLLASPPPSPGLPALIPRHGKPLPSPAPRRFIRAVFWLFGIFVIVHFGLANIRLWHSVPRVGSSDLDDQEYEIVAEDKLPDYPTPIVVTDKRGRPRWTVSIPPSSSFPLEQEVYAEICRQNVEVSMHVQDLHHHKSVTHPTQYGYYHIDPYFVDVAEAEQKGMLPGLTAKSAANAGSSSMKDNGGHIIGETHSTSVEQPTCAKSLTFVLETADAGLGRTMMMLWSAYGLAQKEGRAFFIDDTRWAYGKYTNLFQPPPIPGCRPPPRHHMLPCPHNARHLVVSAATVESTFGIQFQNEFEAGQKSEIARQKPVFALARVGFEALFKLNDADQAYIDERLLEMSAKTVLAPPEKENGMIVGVHVRHGGCHPLDFQYKDSYIPLYRYSDKAREILYQKFSESGRDGKENMMAEMHSVFVVASDDPDVYDSMEFAHAWRAQEHIPLASKKAMGEQPKPAPTGNMFKNFVEEVVGWEGGFYSAMFWNLGRSPAATAPDLDFLKAQPQPSAETLRLRELVGRAYLMDLAILGRASDAIVCAVSSIGCNLLAVMMGWEAAMEQKKWQNIDGEFGWRGVYAQHEL